MPNLDDIFAAARADESYAVARSNAESGYQLLFDLVRARKDLGLTQRDVAERLHITQQAVSKIEDYDSDPKLSTLRAYADAIGLLLGHSVQPVAEYAGQNVRWVAQKVFVPIAETRAPAPISYSAANSKRTDFAMAA